jgi:hypothetical protein
VIAARATLIAEITILEARQFSLTFSGGAQPADCY